MNNKRAAPAQPLDALWRPSTLIACFAAGLALAAVLALAPGVAHASWRYFVLLSSAVLWTMAVTLVLMYASRHILAKMASVQIAWIALGLLVFNALAVTFLCWTVFIASDNNLSGLLLKASAITLIVGLVGVAVFDTYWRKLSETAKAKQAELDVLHARIQPHFLFNTLNTATVLVHQRPDAAESLLLDLSELFRAALSGPQAISLQEELDLAVRYLEIESLRFGDRLNVIWKVLEPLPETVVPALTIQTLLENAIKHGIEPAVNGGTVLITIESDEENALIRIENAVHKNPAHVHNGHQLGLQSSKTRVEALTQGNGGVFTQERNERFITTVRLPLIQKI